MMALQIPFGRTIARPRIFRCSHSSFIEALAVPVNPGVPMQARLISRAPPDPWRSMWKDISMNHVTFKAIEASCNMAKRTGQMIGIRSTPVEYHECAQAFFEAVQKGSSPGSTYLLDSPEFDPALIYETGCIIRTLHAVRTPFESAMWASSSGLGFHPATITLAGELVDRMEFGKMPAMAKVEVEFRRIVKQGKDANALCVEGLRLLLAEKKPLQAATVLKRALSVAGPNFSYKTRCDHVLGHIAYSQGKMEEAAAYLESAYEVDPSSGFLLGEVYSSLKPDEAGQAYFSAGFAGSTKAWGRLADMELGRAMEATDAQAKRQHELWAMEFQRLSNSAA